MSKPRKEKVLHTRVPAVLEEELKRLAAALRVPVSNVVRTILEDAVDTVDVVGGMAEDQLHNVADRLGRRRGRMRRDPMAAPVEDRAAPGPPLAGVVGYQHMLLARGGQCTLCGREMSPGEAAWLGVRETPGPRVLIDAACLPFSAAESAPPEERGDDNDRPT